MTKATSTRSLPWKDNIAYSMGNLGSNLIFAMIMFYMTFFYTDVLKIPAATAGILFLMARMWDAVNDPVMGFLVDRTSTRWGKFRPFIIIGIIPCALLYVLAFTVPDLSQTGRVLWAFFTYIPLGMAVTFINIPYHAQTTILTTDSMERAEVGAVSNIAALIATLIVAATTLPLVNSFSTQAKGFTAATIIFGTIMVVCYLITFVFTRKYDLPLSTPKKSAAGQHGFRETFRVLGDNRPLISLMTAYFFVQTAMSVVTAAAIYFFKYYLNAQNYYPIFMAAFLILMAAGMAVVPPLARKFGKKNLFQASNLGHSLGLLSIFLLLFFKGGSIIQSPFVWLLLPGVFLTAFCNGPVVALVWGMLPDTVEYAELKVGIRSEGLIFALLSFTMKAGLALGGAITAFGLDFIGYIPGVAQSPEALGKLLILCTLVPLVFRIPVWGAMHFYNLSEKQFAQILTELDFKTNGSKEKLLETQ